MSRLILEPSATAAWHKLVTEAAECAGYDLDEQCESYLVFLLMRYLRRAEMVRSVLALQFLEGMGERGSARREQLQRVGDQCLIFAGLFPEQARRRRVRLSYFVDIGQSAYGGVAQDVERPTAELFEALAETFVALADVLRALRRDREAPLMSAMEAAERSLETDSGLARDCLRDYTDATLITPTERRH